MSFSDEDLKRLKESIEAHGDHLLPGTFVLRPLLARLEAAERVAQFAFISEHPLDDSTQEAYESRQKSKRSTGGEKSS